MMKVNLVKKLILAIALANLSACSTTPDGNQVFNVVDGKQLSAMGLSAFDELKAKTKISQDQALQNHVRCVTTKLIAELPAAYAGEAWEVVVFEDESPNAFALPGGKVGVHTGLFNVAQNEDQLAAVIGHELSHVTYQHGGQRVSQQMALQAAGTAVQMYTGRDGGQRNPYLEAAIGLGGQLGVLLPFTRKHESQADKEGQILMARAGYNPMEASNLWENMAAASKGSPPQWLSTHPAPENRREKLAERAPDLQALAESAKAMGKGAPCK